MYFNFILCIPLIAEEIPEKYSFLELKSLKQNESESVGKWIEIRGFLYESPEHGLILASEPNLKSCCVGNSSKREKQLFVEGLNEDVNSIVGSSMVVTLKGILVVDHSEIFSFKLKNAEVVKDARKDNKLWRILGGFLVVFIIVTLGYRARKTQR